MLTLLRRVGESVIITVPPSDKQQTIVVTYHRDHIYGRDKNGVHLSFDADRSIRIDREEIHVQRNAPS